MSYYGYPFDSNFGDENNRQQRMSGNYPNPNSTPSQWGASSQYPSTHPDPTRNLSPYPPVGAGYPPTPYNSTALQSQYMNQNPAYPNSTYTGNAQYIPQNQQYQGSLASPGYPSVYNTGGNAAAPPAGYGGGHHRSTTPYPQNPQAYRPSTSHAQIVLPEASEDQRASIGGKQCANCGTRTTPAWRRDPSTHRTLCNACGVYLSTRKQDRPQKLIDVDNEPSGGGSGEGSGGPACTNCGTHSTSTWRRNRAGEQVCNACGVYERTNGRPRPPEMRSNKIRPREKH